MGNQRTIALERLAKMAIMGLWLGEVYVLSLHRAQFENAGALYWIFVSVGVMSVTHTINFYSVGEWFRGPFTHEEKDSAGNRVNVEPNPGKLHLIGELMCCYACAGTHAGTILLLTYAYRPDFGWMLAAAFFIASVNALLHEGSEYMKSKARYYTEVGGSIYLDKVHGRGEANRQYREWMGLPPQVEQLPLLTETPILVNQDIFKTAIEK